MFNYKSNVLLPGWLLEKENNQDFISFVNDYLKNKYPDYQLIEVIDGFAICTRKGDWNG